MARQDWLGLEPDETGRSFSLSAWRGLEPARRPRICTLLKYDGRNHVATSAAPSGDAATPAAQSSSPNLRTVTVI